MSGYVNVLDMDEEARADDLAKAAGEVYVAHFAGSEDWTNYGPLEALSRPVLTSVSLQYTREWVQFLKKTATASLGEATPELDWSLGSLDIPPAGSPEVCWRRFNARSHGIKVLVITINQYKLFAQGE